MIRTIIIDDERSAVNVLATLLQKKCSNEVEVIATTTSALEGKRLIEERDPDLVFIDIEMSGMTGIEIIRSFNNPRFHVVFVTAHDGYALEAIQLSAVDYMLKPIGPDSLLITIDKIKERIRLKHNNLADPIKKLEQLLSRTAEGNESKIGIAMADKIVFVYIRDILYCEANSSYTNVHLLNGTKMVASKSLGYFEELLKSYKFFRIHHSFLINLNRIKEYKRQEGGFVIMENNNCLEVSRRKKNEFLDAIDNFVV